MGSQMVLNNPLVWLDFLGEVAPKGGGKFSPFIFPN